MVVLSRRAVLRDPTHSVAQLTMPLRLIRSCSDAGRWPRRNIRLAADSTVDRSCRRGGADSTLHGVASGETDHEMSRRLGPCSGSRGLSLSVT